MTLLPKRLKRDWFHAYVADPQQYPAGHAHARVLRSRARACCPTSSTASRPRRSRPSGSTSLDGGQGPAPGRHGQDRSRWSRPTTAIIYRNFIEGAGPRAIGVGYPGEGQPGLRRQRNAAGAALAGRVHRRRPSTGPTAARATRRRWATTSCTCTAGVPFAVLAKARRRLADHAGEGAGLSLPRLPADSGRPADVPLLGRRRQGRGLPQRRSSGKEVAAAADAEADGGEGAGEPLLPGRGRQQDRGAGRRLVSHRRHVEAEGRRRQPHDSPVRRQDANCSCRCTSRTARRRSCRSIVW